MLKFGYITEIRPHLYSIPLVKMMVDMYSKYKETTHEDARNILESEFKVDPVLRFVAYVLYNSRKDFLDYSEEEQLGIIRYITAVFYSVKGTAAVFTKLTSLLGFEYDTDEDAGVFGVVYTPEKLDFRLRPDCVTWVTEQLKFIDYFTEFLNELLFLGAGTVLEDTITFGIDAITMKVEDTIGIRTSSSIDLFRYTLAKE